MLEEGKEGGKGGKKLSWGFAKTLAATLHLVEPQEAGLASAAQPPRQALTEASPRPPAG